MNPKSFFALSIYLILSIAAPILSQAPTPISRITIDPRQRFQVIDGFGVNFNGTYFRDTQKPMIDMLIVTS
jgi:O-glycosyl hydrolase